MTSEAVFTMYAPFSQSCPSMGSLSYYLQKRSVRASFSKHAFGSAYHTTITSAVGMSMSVLCHVRSNPDTGIWNLRLF